LLRRPLESLGPASFKIVELGDPLPVGVDVSPLAFVEAPASFSDVLGSHAVAFCVHFFWFGVAVGLKPGLLWRGDKHGAWSTVRGHRYVRFVIRRVDVREGRCRWREYSLLKFAEPARCAQKECVQDLVDSWVAELNAKQRAVVERRFGLHGHRRATLEQIGEEIGVTRERVRQIQLDALKNLRAIMERQGVSGDVSLDCQSCNSSHYVNFKAFQDRMAYKGRTQYNNKLKNQSHNFHL